MMFSLTVSAIKENLLPASQGLRLLRADSYTLHQPVPILPSIITGKHGLGLSGRNVDDFWNSIMRNNSNSRRKFLEMLGVSSAGVTFALTASAGKEKLKAGGEEAKQEIEKLQQAYEGLDNRSKLILRLLLFLTGLDIFLG